MQSKNVDVKRKTAACKLGKEPALGGLAMVDMAGGGVVGSVPPSDGNGLSAIPGVTAELKSGDGDIIGNSSGAGAGRISKGMLG